MTRWRTRLAVAVARRTRWLIWHPDHAVYHDATEGFYLADEWWELNGQDLYAALRRAHRGANPADIYARLIVAADRDKPT